MSYQHTNSKGIVYHLRKSEVKLRGGILQTIYFFTKNEENANGEACDLPEDREVVENLRNGFLTLKKKQ